MDTINRLRVKDCCFCISLRTATLTIGYLDAVACFIGMFACLALIIMSALVISAPPEKSKYSAEGDDALAVLLGAYGIVLGIILLLVLAVFFGFSVVLLKGVYKKRTVYIKYWMRFSLGLIVFNAISLIGSLFSGNLVGRSLSPSISSLGWSIYTWIVVRSYYRDLKAELSGHEPAAQAFVVKNIYPHGPYQPTTVGPYQPTVGPYQPTVGPYQPTTVGPNQPYPVQPVQVDNSYRQQQ